MRDDIPDGWRHVLAEELSKPYFRGVEEFVAAERMRGAVYPAPGDVFAALYATPFDTVRVVIVGQDPYHGEGEADGLAFSVPRGIRIPPSLANIQRELQTDVGCRPNRHGSLADWCHRGVLLLNSVLTVRANEPNSHRKLGWEQFTGAILAALNQRKDPVVFLFWGRQARSLGPNVDRTRHAVVEGVHPSPLSAHRGFLGSKPFSAVNSELIRLGRDPVDWCITE